MRALVPFLLSLLLPVSAGGPFAGGQDEGARRDPGGDRGAIDLDSASIVAVELRDPPATRTEWFRLDLPDTAEPVGLVRLLFAAESEDVFRLESEVHFFDAGTRVRHVEVLEPEGLRLVWREMGPGRGRTVLVEWKREEPAVRVTDTNAGVVHRSEIDASAGALMPLYLLEKLRAGDLLEGSFRRYEPTSNSVEELGLAPCPLVPFPGSPGGLALFADARVLEWRRSDGGCAGRYAFDGRRLVAFQWQDGGATARAIEEGAYRKLLESGWRASGRD